MNNPHPTNHPTTDRADRIDRLQIEILIALATDVPFLRWSDPLLPAAFRGLAEIPEERPEADAEASK